MRAIVIHGPGDLRVEERPVPVPATGEALVAMEWGGICGSDLAYWQHGRSGTANLRHPMVLGHEVAGRVSSLGPGTGGTAAATIGQAVTVHPALLVGDVTMPPRLTGRTNLHPRVRYFGSAAFDPHTDGGFSEYRTVPVDQLRALPDAVDTRRGALAEPLAVALHAVSRLPVVLGKTVLVNGCGPIGSLVIAALKYRGADAVLASDVSETALAVACEMGADHTALVPHEPLPEDVEIVVEASGSSAALGSVLRAAARGGTVVQVGNLPGEPAPATLGDLVSREITWIGSYRFADEIDDAIDALAHGLDVDPLVTHEFDLDRAADAMQVALDRSTGSGKVLLRLGSPERPTTATRVHRAGTEDGPTEEDHR